MAVVAYTSYNENIACQRTNDYLTNGHGTDAAARSNRYVSDGHGQTTLCVGHNCPSDPVLATEYMGLLRSNYERQHPPSKGRQKGSVTHVQFYVSPTEEDNVPAQERIDMTLELIQRTPLRDFSSILVPHDNTPDKHCHISLCPYSVDGTRKLCLNNSLLNTLRREMDRICVEHGYSIIENRELWADPEYREYFSRLKEQGTIKIHPPKDQDMSSFKKDRNRARSYTASKAAQKKKLEDLEAECKWLTKKRLPGMERFWYKSSFLYDPLGHDRHLRIRKKAPDGRMLSDIELSASSLFVWGNISSKSLAQRKIPGSRDLQRRMNELSRKAYAASRLFRELDIRTEEELVAHIKNCGQDIGELKKNIRYQESIINDMAPLLEAIDCWESSKDPAAYAYLWEHHCFSEQDIAAQKKCYDRAVARKETSENLLLKYKAEYRHCKEAEAILRPAACRSEYLEYMQKVFTKKALKDFGYCSREDLCDALYQLAEGCGMSKVDAALLIEKAVDEASKNSVCNYRDILRLAYWQVKNNPSVNNIYRKMNRKWEGVGLLRKFSYVEVSGPFTFFLGMFLALVSGLLEGLLRCDAESLKLDAKALQAELQSAGGIAVEDLHLANKIYQKEIKNASPEAINNATNRFYRKASEILQGLGIQLSPEELMDHSFLDLRIAEIESTRYKASANSIRAFENKLLKR